MGLATAAFGIEVLQDKAGLGLRSSKGSRYLIRCVCELGSLLWVYHKGPANYLGPITGTLGFLKLLNYCRMKSQQLKQV